MPWHRSGATVVVPLGVAKSLLQTRLIVISAEVMLARPLFQILKSAVFEFMSFVSFVFHSCLDFYNATLTTCLYQRVKMSKHFSSTFFNASKLHRGWGTVCQVLRNTNHEKKQLQAWQLSFSATLSKASLAALSLTFFERKCEESYSTKSLEQQLDFM